MNRESQEEEHDRQGCVVAHAIDHEIRDGQHQHAHEKRPAANLHGSTTAGGVGHAARRQKEDRLHDRRDEESVTAEGRSASHSFHDEQRNGGRTQTQSDKTAHEIDQHCGPIGRVRHRFLELFHLVDFRSGDLGFQLVKSRVGEKNQGHHGGNRQTCGVDEERCAQRNAHDQTAERWAGDTADEEAALIDAGGASALVLVHDAQQQGHR